MAAVISSPFRRSAFSIARSYGTAAMRPSPRAATPTSWSTALKTQRSTFSTGQKLHQKFYSKDHDWVEIQDNGTTARIGISKYAADQLGDATYVEVPEIDAEVAADDAIGCVESVKSASDIISPVSGKVVQVNEELTSRPALLNESPEDQAWVAEIELSDKEEVEKHMDADKYHEFCQ